MMQGNRQCHKRAVLRQALDQLRQLPEYMDPRQLGLVNDMYMSLGVA